PADLIMSQAPILLKTNSSYQAYTIPLARDVTFFKLAFYDAQKNDWLDEWKYTNQLPKLVQIGLGLGKTAGNPNKPYELVYSLVALPSVGVAPDVQVGRVVNPADPNPSRPNPPPPPRPRTPTPPATQTP